MNECSHLRTKKARRFISEGASWLLKGLILITITLLCIPFSPVMPSMSLDPSWSAAINQGVVQNLIFGKDLIFTFGPFASLYTHYYHPEINQYMMFAAAILALSYSSLFLFLIRNTSKILLLFLWLFSVHLLIIPDALFFTYPLLAFLCCLKLMTQKQVVLNTQRKYIDLALVFLWFLPFGLFPLIKGSILLLMVVTLGLCIALFFDYRKFSFGLVSIISALISMAFFWKISGADISGLYAYYTGMGDIIAGYSGAMALRGNSNEVLTFLLAAFLLLFVLLKDRTILIKPKLLLFLATGFYVFIVFKAGFVRHDGHAQISASAILMACILLAIFFEGNRIYFILMSVCFLCVYQNITHYGLFSPQFRHFSHRISFPYQSAWHGIKTRLFTDNLNEQYIEALQGIQKKTNFPKLTGTVDIYSYNQASLFASRNQWNPRPIFQSYSAYTPNLAKINREHLLINAPDNIIFGIEAIDNRLPSLEDGMSWPVLLLNYQPFNFQDNFLYLKKKLNANSSNITKIMRKANYSFGQNITIPESRAPIFAEVKILPTLFGKFMGFAYKPNEIQIKLSLCNGEKTVYRFIPSMAESEFLLSPLVQNTSDFTFLYGNAFPKKVCSFSLESIGGQRQWKKQFQVTLKKMLTPPPHVNLSKICKFNPVRLNLDNVKLSYAKKCEGSIDMINRKGGATDKTLKLSGVIEVFGWLAKITKENGIRPAKALLRLHRDGQNVFIETSSYSRADIGLAFKSIADISKLEGEYDLSMAYFINNEKINI